MKGDYSKIPFNDTKKKQHYRKVYLQQGRVLLDSDLNENTDLLHYQTKTLAKDVACLCGSPNNGFRVGKGLILMPVDSKKGWSLAFSDEDPSEPTISYEPSDIFEGKGSLMVKDVTKAFFTPQKPIDLSRCRWIRLGLKGKGNTVPENMLVKLSLESNGDIATVEKDKEISMENGFSFFNYSLKNINPQDFKYIDKITSIEFSGFDNKPEENMYLFNWSKILAKDNQELIDFVKQKYSIDWVKAEQVKITDDNKTIRLDSGNNYILLNINNEGTRVSLKTNDGKLDEFAIRNENGELKVYLGKSYLMGIVECSPPMFTLDTMQSDWSYEEPTPKVDADVSIVSSNGEGSTIEAKGIIKLKKELSVPIDFSNYATMEFSLKRIGSSTSIEFYIIDIDKKELAWEISNFSNTELKKHSISVKAQNPDEINIRSVIGYGFRQLSPSDTYNLGRILYEIDPSNNFVIAGSDMLSGETGRLYVNGELYEKEEAETYLNQKEYPYPTPIVPPESGFRKDLVYAEVWERHITPIEDQQLRETALGGPDTCNRIKAVVQVKVQPRAESLPENLMPTGGGRLSTTVARSSLAVKSCEMSPESEYTGWENRLYRVEMYHTDKPAFVPSHTWIPPIKTPPLFKWSKNNASTTSPIVQNVEKDANSVVVKDSRLFKIGDIIEISDDLVELSGIYEELRIITYIDPDENRLFWKKDLQSAASQSGPLLYAGLSRFYVAEGTEMTHPKVVKWDGVDKITSSSSIELEDGVKIRFSGTNMRKGDYWTFTARAATHEVERLENEPPHGVIRHYCPLALIHWNGSTIDRIEDIRGRFKPLGELSATDIAFDCKNSAILANNVQQAIENLQIKLDYGTNLDLIVGSLTIRGSELDRTHWPKLTCSKREDGSKHGDICFLTGGDSSTAEKMRILEEGHIGIGTMNPKNDETGDKWDKVLDIYSCLNAKLSIRTKSIDARVQVQEKDDNVIKGKVWKNSPDGMIVGTKSKSKLSLATSGEARIVVDEDGKVGIGTTTPILNTKLDIQGGGLNIGGTGNLDAAIHVKSSFGNFGRLLQMSPLGASKPGLNLLASNDKDNKQQWWVWGVDTDDKWKIQPGTNFLLPDLSDGAWFLYRTVPGLFIDRTGNVGIGAVNPSEKLEIAGNIKLIPKPVSMNQPLIHYENWIMVGIKEESENTQLNKALGFRFVNQMGGGTVGNQIIVGEDWTINASTKNFLINHPLYPETHELVHSTLEGPEIAVFYRGEAELSGGETRITLPAYFEALTRKENRTVLLTPKFEEGIKVSTLAASEVKDGKFTVKMIDSNNPSQKFYWEVKAIRADVGILEVERKKVSVK